MDFTIDVATEQDWPAFTATLEAAFNTEPDPEVEAAERLVYEPARSLVVRRDGQVVATAGILTRDLCVPGGIVPAAHVTSVAVAATARRQGLMTRLMHRQFADARAAGEPVAVLWASEARIYQRFGYGLAIRRLRIAADTKELALRPDAPRGGHLRAVDSIQDRAILIDIFTKQYPNQPGWSGRLERHWDYVLADPPRWRTGGTALRAVIHVGPDGPDGYVLWRAKNAWSEAGPNGEVNVIELVATNPPAYAELWRFLLSVDLTRTVNYWMAAQDEPLQLLVNEPRRLNARLSDALWLRVLDLPVALASRGYATEIDLVLNVNDDLISGNRGTWRLVGGHDSAHCTPSTADADVSCDISALSAAYLGGTAWATLAAAGAVTELTPGSVARASAAFTSHPAPSLNEVF